MEKFICDESNGLRYELQDDCYISRRDFYDYYY